MTKRGAGAVEKFVKETREAHPFASEELVSRAKGWKPMDTTPAVEGPPPVVAEPPRKEPSMVREVSCQITWCGNKEDLLRRKPDSTLFKQFGAMVLCRKHVPPWNQGQYEPVDGPPEPTKVETAAPSPPPTSPEFDKAGAKERVAKKRAERVEAKKEGAPF